MTALAAPRPDGSEEALRHGPGHGYRRASSGRLQVPKSLRASKTKLRMWTLASRCRSSNCTWSSKAVVRWGGCINAKQKQTAAYLYIFDGIMAREVTNMNEHYRRFEQPTCGAWGLENQYGESVVIINKP